LAGTGTALIAGIGAKYLTKRGMDSIEENSAAVSATRTALSLTREILAAVPVQSSDADSR